MRYTDEQLKHIFDKTGGHCYWCGKQLSFSNYGQCLGATPLARGAWEVDHAKPTSKGGTDTMRNWV
ncbi:MAG: HNH endonuclease, partial [candidate division WOR-3 bacterium]